MYMKRECGAVVKVSAISHAGLGGAFGRGRAATRRGETITSETCRQRCYPGKRCVRYAAQAATRVVQHGVLQEASRIRRTTDVLHSTVTGCREG